MFQILQENQLYVKTSKCQLGVSEVKYLGHVVSVEGVAIDQEKIQAILDWPVPRNLRALGGIWGLQDIIEGLSKNLAQLWHPLLL